MRLFFFWAGLFIIFAFWNTSKYNGYDPLEMVKSIYIQHEDSVEVKQEKVWPDTFEHLQKHTE